MSIRTYNEMRDLCLVKAYDKCYVGYIDLPQINWSLSDYNEYLQRQENNMICIGSYFTPQAIPYNDMSIIWCKSEIETICKVKYGNPPVTPIYDFRKVLIDMLQSDTPELVFYKSIENLFNPKQ